MVTNNPTIKITQNFVSFCNLDTCVSFLRTKICMQSEQRNNVMRLVDVKVFSFSVFSELKDFAE